MDVIMGKMCSESPHVGLTNTKSLLDGREVTI